MDICKHYKNNFTWRRNWIWYHFHMAAMTIPKTQSFYILSLLFVACQRTQNVRFSLGSNLVMTPCTFTYRIVATLTYQCAPGSTTSTILTALFYSNMKIQKCRCFGADSPKISLLWKFSKKKKNWKPILNCVLHFHGTIFFSFGNVNTYPLMNSGWKEHGGLLIVEICITSIASHGGCQLGPGKFLFALVVSFSLDF